MSTGSVNITYCDIEMQIEYEATPYYPQTYEHPAEGGDFDINEVIVGGVNIISLISKDDMDKIQQMAINDLEINED